MFNLDLLKNIVFAIIGIIVPVLYSYITSKFPNFPLTQDQILALLIWAAGFFFSGANVAYFHAKSISPKFVYSRQKLFKIKG